LRSPIGQPGVGIPYYQRHISLSLQKCANFPAARHRDSASSRVICSPCGPQTTPLPRSTHISIPPDPEASTARRRRSRSLRIFTFLDCPKPLIEFTGLECLDVSFHEVRKFRCFARRHLASGNSGCERCHCAGCVRSGSKCGQLEAHCSFAARRPVCFQQRQKQMIGVASDRDRLAIIIANDFTSTD